MLADIFLVFVGFVVGSMNAIAGGGMLIGFPAMMLAGISPLVANVTANMIVFPGQIASAYGYRNYLRKVPRFYAWLLVPCAVGAAIGATILRHTPSAKFQELVPSLVLFAVVLFALQPFLHFHLHKHMHSRKKTIPPLVLIGLAFLPVAIYGGYFGAGIGFVMLAFLGFTNVHDTHKINAMKNVAATVIGIVSLSCLLTSGKIDWHHGIIMAIGCIAGGYTGSRFAQKIPSHALRAVVIIIGFSAAIYLGLRTY